MKLFYPTLLFLLPITGLSAQAWTSYTPPFGDTIGIADVKVVNENVIWVVGYRYGVDDSLYYYGYANETYYAVTSDGGATWKTGAIPMGPVPFLANMTATDAGTAMVAGLSNFGDAKTLKTTDGGTSWEVTPNNWDPVASWPDYITSFSPARYTVVGDPRNGEFEIYTTFNAGQVWQSVQGSHIPDPLSGEFGFNNCGATVGSNMWFGTNLGRIYHSANNGLDWTAAQTPLESIGLLSFSDETHGVVTSSYGIVPVFRLCTTSDGGDTWSELSNLPYNGHFLGFGISYIPQQPYIILGLTTGGLLSGEYQTWLSKDRGMTWQQISTGEIVGWPEFISPTTGWAGDFQQLSRETRLYKYAGSPLLGLLSPVVLDAEVTLSPNPVKDIAHLKVHADKTNTYWIMLHNREGRLIERKSFPETSDFETEFNVGNLPAGNYTITVCSTSGSVTKPFSKSN